MNLIITYRLKSFKTSVIKSNTIKVFILTLKVITKSYSGDAAVSDGIAGTPPPVLLFEYLGEHGFNKVPVIIKDYSIQLDPEVDYVPVHYKMKGADTVTYVPTSCFISINMSVSYTPKKLRKQFDIKGLTTGAAYSDGFI